MAAIQTAIELNDQFTSVLYGIMDAVNLATAQMYDMQQAMSMDIDNCIKRCGTAAGFCPESACRKFCPGRDSSAVGNEQSGCVYRNRNGSVRAGSTECQ